MGWYSVATAILNRVIGVRDDLDDRLFKILGLTSILDLSRRDLVAAAVPMLVGDGMV